MNLFQQKQQKGEMGTEVDLVQLESPKAFIYLLFCSEGFTITAQSSH